MKYLASLLLVLAVGSAYAEDSPTLTSDNEAQVATPADTPADTAEATSEATSDATAALSAGCQQDVDTIRTNLAALQNQFDQCQNTSQKIQDEWQQRLTRCDAELQQTRQTVNSEVDKQTSTAQSLSTCQAELVQAQQHDLKLYVAPAQGGTATADSARQQASIAKDAYMARMKVVMAEKGDRLRDADLLQARRNLASAQALLLQVTEGIGLYGIRRNDTLSVISKEVYGNGNRWRDIFTANQHILPNENQIETGLSLVLPR